MCASEMIEHRKGSWELYGFDYMVDDEYNAWLIEINSSPACDYSTKTTERYVQKALVELLSVVLDVREWEEAPRKGRGPKPSTGGWECIYQGPLLDMPMGAFGTDMTLRGEGYKNAPRHAPQAVPVNDFVSRNIQQLGGEMGATAAATGVVNGRQSLLPRPPPAAVSRNPGGNAGRGQSLQSSSPKYASQLQQPRTFTNSNSSAATGSSSKQPSSEPVSAKGGAVGDAAAGGEDKEMGFDDSDEEETREAGSGRRAASERTKQGNSGGSRPVAKPVNSSSAAIPIKVFTVDF